ncbi:unnamed protein product [Adineta steineri]|uniref:Uncharacterized protein n=1 Tax=Adineta steineri TaxID=433720 RepID=A0A814LA20_9BILA|nr:unnamed protein product [Adineta steineri]CAF1062284.1 unnamed protein product [Adineta steineri]
MSMEQNETHDNKFLATSIKLENETDDDLSYDEAIEVNKKNDYCSNLSSASTILQPSTYKGKIEVTSKGRRKIFDGVRWQILCRRPECRKQTNKKSLCITHYKEEYESNPRSSSSSSWPNNLQSYQLSSYKQQQQHLYDNTKTRSEIEDQNNTITTTNITENSEQSSLNINNNQLIHDGQIEYRNNGRRFILKNNKWLPLCKYDNNCRNTAKYELLCIKHFELTQQKRRNLFKFHNNDKQHLHSTIFDKHRSVFTNDITKRLKINDFQISSSSITEQFDINSNENIHMSTATVDDESSLLASKYPGHKAVSFKKNLNTISSNYALSDKQKNDLLKNDQAVQTDITIPLCCIIQHEDHLFYSTCKNNKSTSSNIPFNTKSEPQSFHTNFST